MIKYKVLILCPRCYGRSKILANTAGYRYRTCPKCKDMMAKRVWQSPVVKVEVPDVVNVGEKQ